MFVVLKLCAYTAKPFFNLTSVFSAVCQKQGAIGVAMPIINSRHHFPKL